MVTYMTNDNDIGGDFLDSLTGAQVVQFVDVTKFVANTNEDKKVVEVNNDRLTGSI